MDKKITLRFAQKCRKCQKLIPSGDLAMWLGAGKGVRHLTCSPEPAPNAPKPKDESVDKFTISYSELRSAFGAFIENPMSVYSESKNREAGMSLRSGWTPSWVGISTAEMSEFIRSGYHVSGLDGVESLIPAKPRRKMVYGEEGDELLIDMAWGGSDTPFVTWEKRASKPGLSVEIHMVFHAGFPAKTIAAYQRWIAQALQTLDENGVDMEVSIVNTLRGLFVENRAQKTETHIRVREAGEAADFANWSAMFSPGGYRMLGIMATGIHADRRGERVGSGYGQPQPYGAWTVDYDEENGRIVIGNSQTERDFPEFEMTEKLMAVLTALSG